MDRHTAADTDSGEYQEALYPRSSLLYTVDTSTARASHPYGLPLAVERPPWYSRLHQNVISGALMGVFSYGYFHWRPITTPVTALSFAFFMAGYSTMSAIGDDYFERRVGMEAAETQRRADSKIVMRVLDTSFLGLPSERRI